MKAKAVNTIHWRKYLDVNENPRVKGFLDSRGDDVMWQVGQNIRRAVRRDLTELNLLIHENAPYAIKIEKKDFEEVMNLSLSWFEQKEEYEKCSEIFTWMGELKEKKNKKEMAKLI